jgi:hypothetical protein
MGGSEHLFAAIVFSRWFESCKRTFHDLSLVFAVVSALAFVIASLVRGANLDTRVFSFLAILLSLSTYEVVLTGAPTHQRSVVRGIAIMYIGIVCVALFVFIMTYIIGVVSASCLPILLCFFVLVVMVNNLIFWRENRLDINYPLEAGSPTRFDLQPEVVSANTRTQIEYEKQWYARQRKLVVSEVSHWEERVHRQQEAICQLCEGTDLARIVADENVRDEIYFGKLNSLYIEIEKSVPNPDLAETLRTLLREYLLELEALGVADVRAAWLKASARASNRRYGSTIGGI